MLDQIRSSVLDFNKKYKFDYELFLQFFDTILDKIDFFKSRYFTKSIKNKLYFSCLTKKYWELLNNELFVSEIFSINLLVLQEWGCSNVNKMFLFGFYFKDIINSTLVYDTLCEEDYDDVVDGCSNNVENDEYFNFSTSFYQGSEMVKLLESMSSDFLLGFKELLIFCSGSNENLFLPVEVALGIAGNDLFSSLKLNDISHVFGVIDETNFIIYEKLCGLWMKHHYIAGLVRAKKLFKINV
jgi:hypothetical protein